ncbi:conserved hypothetical protein [Arthrobacter sp. Hiyo4]|nr:conserved hypothetical protein [Arthrobacter sp. Hiyo4]
MATHTGTRTAARTNVQKASIVVGAVFLLVGILGFVPGITANFDELHFAGQHSEAMLLGLFQVSALHNIVHLLFGAAGLLMAKTATGAALSSSTAASSTWSCSFTDWWSPRIQPATSCR